MDEHLKDLYQQHFQFYQELNIREEDVDYRLLDRHLAFLDTLDVVQSSSISVFDMYRKEHVYLSRKFETVLGYDLEEASREGNQYFDDRIHPEDLEILLTEGLYFLRMGRSLPGDQWKDYKYISDYRVLNGKREYVRIIEQKILLETDKSGKPWLALCILDLSPEQDLSLPARNRLINVKTGELLVFKEENSTPDESLTRREKEILRLISLGMISKQIADKLFISVNTVNTHRQNIIEKLHASNMAEALHYAGRMNLLDFKRG